MAAQAPSQFCPFCGTSNPPGYNFCLQCHRALPPAGPVAPSAPAPEPDSFQLVTARRDATTLSLNVGRGFWGILFLYLGIPMLLIGIGLLIGSVVVAQGVANFNQACSMNPLCSPQPDPSGAFAAGGVVVLILGIVLVAYGISQYRNQPS
ncbi:MAG: zinc ribbon domain-containing protein [Thermoplasmata archaeon]